MEPYLTALRQLYQPQADPEQAGPMKKYMRDQFDFLGIKSPQMKVLFKQFLAANGLPDLPQLEAIARELWTWPEREYQYVALSLLDKLDKQLTPEQLPLLAHLIITKSWWDTVDSLASHNVGKLLSRYPDRRYRLIEPWRQSDNLWLRRTTLLFQLSYKTQTDEALLFAIVNENQTSSEFFIQKAIGWALREYSKTAPDAVITFVGKTELAPLSRREALKWLKAKGYSV